MFLLKILFLKDKAEDLQAVDSCEYIWEKGVGFAQSPIKNATFESNRTELLRLLLTCFSQAIYSPNQSKLFETTLSI